MTDVQKDVTASAMTLLAVVTLVVTWQGWGVYLIGDSHRWAATLVSLLGVAACALGMPAKDGLGRFLAGLGAIALVLAVVAIATGSLPWLTVLVATVVVLWFAATIEHVSERHTHSLAL